MSVFVSFVILSLLSPEKNVRLNGGISKSRSMERDEITIELLYRKLENCLTEEEAERFDVWIHDVEHQRYYEHIKSLYELQKNGRTEDEEVTRAWVDFRSRINGRKQKSVRYRLLWGSVVAASVVILLGVIPFALMKDVQPVASVTGIQIRPGQRNAILELAGGQVYDLKQFANAKDTCIAGHIMVDSCRLNYTRPDSGGFTELAYNKIIVPRGGEFQILLEDGTKVWLNSESQLRYPEVFIGSRREVFLEGEAYFEVAKDAAHPFIVHTGIQQVTVLGTSFGITGYAEEASVSATLVEGKVSVEYPGRSSQKYILEPGYRISFDKNNGQIDRQAVNVREYTAWKDGKYSFSQRRLEDMLNTLSRWYDFEVFYQNVSCKELLFTGELHRFENFNSILELIEKTSDVRFSVNGNVVQVISKN